MEFNFHHDVVTRGDEAVNEIVSVLGKWDEAKAVSSEIVQAVSLRDRK
jgi:hypothetical protein